MDIILEILKKERDRLQKKRDIFNKKAFPEKDYMCQALDIRTCCQNLMKKFGNSSKEVCSFINKNGDKQQVLLKLAKWANKNYMSNMDKEFEMDQQIGKLNSEIVFIEMRETIRKGRKNL